MLTHNKLLLPFFKVSYLMAMCECVYCSFMDVRKSRYLCTGRKCTNQTTGKLGCCKVTNLQIITTVVSKIFISVVVLR